MFGLPFSPGGGGLNEGGGIGLPVGNDERVRVCRGIVVVLVHATARTIRALTAAPAGSPARRIPVAGRGPSIGRSLPERFQQPCPAKRRHGIRSITAAI